MTEIKINWLSSCPKCGCSEAIVKTKGNEKWLYEDDIATCLECKNTGTIQADEGHAWVIWSSEND